MLLYDLEIANPIPPQNGVLTDGIKYAKGWDYHATMGIACVVVYEYAIDTWHIFGEYELPKLQEIINANDVYCGFNNIRFDNRVLRAFDIKISDQKSYDICAEVQRILGYQKGCKLEDIAKANFARVAKNGDGAMAPIRWQQGYHTEVINYCMNDVRMTKMLLDRILRWGYIKNPLDPEKLLKMRRP